MIRPPLVSEVFARYRSDKMSGVPEGHSYGRFYDATLSHYRWCEAVLEIGVFEGESLKAFREFFPDAVIYGIDNDPKRLATVAGEERLVPVHLDASDEAQMRQFASEHAGRFSVILDDGPHRIEDQLLAVRTLKRALRIGGLLVVEDVGSAEDGLRLAAEGLRIEEWDTDKRVDNRLGWYLHTGD